MYVDITKKSIVTSVEWFHGYGGNALGLGRSIPGLRSVAVCERDAFVVANMVSKMEKGLLDAVPIWTDVTDFPTEPFGYQQLDLFVASYPCQGFSHAGKRLGVDDHRHLWPYCRKFIRAVRPGFVWLENVEGHVSLGLSTVLADLEEDGYTAAWGIFSASEVGAPHQRKRVFILAYDKNARASEDKRGIWPEACGVVRGKETVKELFWPSRPGASQYGWEPPRVVGNAGLQRQEVGQVQAAGVEQSDESGNLGNADKRGLESASPEGGHRTEDALRGNGEKGKTGGDIVGQTQPPLGGNADGPANGLDFPGRTGLSDTELAEIREWMVKGTNRTDELRMCGNGVVPQTAERAFRVLHAELCRDRKTERELIGDL